MSLVLEFCAKPFWNLVNSAEEAKATKAVYLSHSQHLSDKANQELCVSVGERTIHVTCFCVPVNSCGCARNCFSSLDGEMAWPVCAHMSARERTHVLLL